jgi:hypothetical protein
MCLVICVGNFETCTVEIPDLSVILETHPGDAYFFLGGDLKHSVGVPETNRPSMELHRWSWILFTHGTYRSFFFFIYQELCIKHRLPTTERNLPFGCKAGGKYQKPEPP